MIEIIGGRLTQWDHARSVQVTNSEATHVHFANPGDVTAVIMKLEDGKAFVPDYLLHTGKAVMAYAVLNGVTVEVKSFPVTKREKPEGYVYEEDTRNYIYAVIAEAEKATDAANKAADAAHQAVQETLDVNVTNESVTKALGYTPAKHDDVDKLSKELAVERERMNTFASLPEGSTVGDAELADARIDKDGKIHANVGEHIRTVTGQLSEQIDECAYLKKSNLYNKNTLVSGYYNYDGTITESVNFSHTPLIYVKGIDFITYTGLTVKGTDPRHIWFDASGNYLKSFLCQIDGTYNETVPEDAYYVSFSIRKDDFDTFECLAYFPIVKHVSNAKEMYDRENFEIDKTTLLDGYVYVEYGAEVIKSVDGYKYTPILPVKSGSTLILNTITPIAYQYMILYDKSNNIIDTIPSQYTDYVRTNKVFNIPTNCTGIRFNTKTSQLPSLGGYYDYVRELTKVTRHKPVISFVDDDTSSVELVERYYNACVLAGVKGNFAVQTMELVNQDGLAELLLEYEEKGFGMLYHCHSQIPAYNVGDTRDIVSAEQNFVRGLRDMRNYGFCNYNYWITPYGVYDSAIKQIAIRHGMKCIASAANWKYNLPTHGNRYFIQRADIPSNDNGTHTLDDLKALINSAKDENAWIICTTHFNTWAEDADDTRIKQIAEYARNLGFECLNFAEAFEIYGNAYKEHELL